MLTASTVAGTSGGASCAVQRGSTRVLALSESRARQTRFCGDSRQNAGAGEVRSSRMAARHGRSASGDAA